MKLLALKRKNNENNETDDFVRLSDLGLYRIKNVYDEGENIADEDINKLFDKFYKVDKARTREYGGNGIGLSIVAAAMTAHRKAYGVYNVPGGVVFYFDLDANLP